MKSKTSFFSVSPAIIREDFRRFWAIPVLAFIGYFLLGLLPIIVNYKLITENGGADAMIVGQLVDAMLSGQNPFLIINLVWVPVLSGLLIFSYLHRTGSVMTVHSQPVTRNTLFRGHVISCVLFTVLPIILTGIVLLVIASPIYDPDSLTAGSQIAARGAEQAAETGRNVFARADIVKWMWDYILISLYILSITIFGGMITGTSLHHFLAAVGFNALVPVCYLLLTMFFSMYLFGYNSMSHTYLLQLHPLMASVDDTHFGVIKSLVYLLIAAAVTAFSLFLYRKRRLERATDGVVFKAANVAITLIFGFLGMSLLGLLFHELFGQSERMTIFGYVAGAVLAMVVIRMIIMKTIRVFDRKLLKIMISYLIVACAFFAVIAFDLTGFESRVPDEEEADGVIVDGIMMTENRPQVILNDPETVALVENLHRELTGMQDDSENAADYEMSTTVRLVYFTGSRDGGDYRETITRLYNIPAGLLYSSQAFTDLQNSEEVKEEVAETLYVPEENIISSSLISIHDEFYSGGELNTETGVYEEYYDTEMSSYDADVPSVSLSREETQELYRIYLDEMTNASGKERVTLNSGMECFEFDVFYSGKSDEEEGSTNTRVFYIRTTNRAAMNWLAEHGYLNNDISSRYRQAVITAFEPDSSGWTMPQFLNDYTDPADDEKSVVTEDSTSINQLFSAMRSFVTDIGTEESLMGTDRVYYLTLYNGSDDFLTGYIAAEDIPEGMALPSVS